MFSPFFPLIVPINFSHLEQLKKKTNFLFFKNRFLPVEKEKETFVKNICRFGIQNWWNYLMNSLRKCIVDLDGVESKDDAPDTSYYQVCKKFLSFYHCNLNFLFHPINHNVAKYFLNLHLKHYLCCLIFLVFDFEF